MPVNLVAPRAQDLLPVPGLRIGVTEAGVRKAGRKDLTVMLLEPGAAVGGVFTRNRFCAAPVQVCREHLESGHAVRAIVINTGNANAGTGEEGRVRARSTCIALARHLNIAPEEVLPFSTGVIMEPLPVDRIQAGLPAALADAREDNWLRAAEGIMTTDTLAKAYSRQVVIEGKTVTITGISKGAGMIRPNMATMLGFVATDAAVAPALLTRLARQVADASFNRITVDGDTSTNDSFIVLATGASGMPVIESINDPRLPLLTDAITAVARQLAQAIVRDGEGATKFIEIIVEGASDAREAAQVGYAVAHSPLVKTAFFASDPNLGRILAAVGNAGIANLDADRVQLHLNEVWVAKDGGRHPQYREEDGQRVMKGSEITVRIALGRGEVGHTVWTCDLSHDYVSINADYRS